MVHSALSSRPSTVDFLVSLLSAALASYRRSSLAKPLPCDPEAAERALRSVVLDPALLESWPAETVSLLHFLLSPDVISVRKIAVSKWAQGVPGASKFLPDSVFEVEHGILRDDYPNPLARMKHCEFSKAAERFPVQIAYHGTELCNLHNILRESLKNDPHLSGRNGQVFGKGIYLSTEASVAQNFLDFGRAWKGSRMGASSIACLLECEVVLDPAQVLTGSDSSASEVPQKYIIVQNDCLVRVKRVLVYHEKTAPRDFRWVGRMLVVLVAILMLAMMLLKNKSSALARLLVWQK